MRELTFNEVDKVGGAGGHIPQLGTPNSNIPRNIEPPPVSGRISPELRELILSRIFPNKSISEALEFIHSGRAGFGPWPGMRIGQ